MISAAVFPLRLTIPKNVGFIFCSVEERYATIIEKVSLCDAFSDSSAYNVRNRTSYISFGVFDSKQKFMASARDSADV